VGNVRQISDALNSPEVIARGLVAEVGNRGQGGYSTVGSPFFFSKTKVRAPEPAPLLGADTDAVLSEVLDYSPARIKELRDSGAIGE
jgi:crotonobetainyl-CoA:carnitine CoA-transferase CaiB-like acyl-CoA transferase